MNIPQPVQSKSSANGFGRRERSENKLQSGKSKPNRSTNAVAGGSPSRDRLVYLLTCLIGRPVEVQLKNGSVYSGTCYTANIDKEFGIMLKMARLTKDVSFQGQKTEFISKAPSETLIIHGKEVVQVTAKDVPETMDGISNELQHVRQPELMLDSFISQSRHVDSERELKPWIPGEDDPQCPELENIFDGTRNRGWDQFETNEMLFGVKSTFDEELYTTKLEKGPQTRELEREAMRIAREIEGQDTQDLHLAEERGIDLHENFDIDEETRFSSVNRGRGVDDSGYEDDEDIMLDSHNTETFGDTSASSGKKSTELTHGKSNYETRVLSSSSLDEAECSQSSADCLSCSYDDARQLASELPPKSFPTSDSGSRTIDDLDGQHGGSDSIKESIEEQTVVGDAQQPKSDGFQYEQKDGLIKGGQFPSSTTCAPSSHFSIKSKDKTSLVELSEGAVSSKVSEETQLINSRGRPSSSTSSTAASASSGPGLSPSSSVSSLVSEKSTLNPHAKEFKLNPNAKSFTPSQMPVRPPSPVSDGSFYYPTNISTLPSHMHSLSMGIGIGPSFAGHQPVILNPQVAPLQPQQTYYHPGGPQYGQQMLLGHHPRPVFYLPSYQPEMPYKGREF